MRCISFMLILSACISLSAQPIVRGDQLLTFSGLDGLLPVAIENAAVSSEVGGLYVPQEGNIVGYFGLQYGLALTNRFTVSGLFGSGLTEDNRAIGLGVNLRYYLKNGENLGIYAGVTGAGAFNTAIEQIDFLLEPAVGFNVPISDNLSLTPQLTYRVLDQRTNSLVLHTQVEFLLGEGRRTPGPVIAAVGKKATMVGVSTSGFSLSTRNGTYTLRQSIRPVLYHFISERFAPGFKFSRNSIQSLNDDLGFEQAVYNLTLNLRYYLNQPGRLTYFIEAGAGAFAQFTDFGGVEIDNDEALFLDAAIGGNFWLAPKIALEFGINGRYFYTPNNLFVAAPTLGGMFVL